MKTKAINQNLIRSITDWYEDAIAQHIKSIFENTGNKPMTSVFGWSHKNIIIELNLINFYVELKVVSECSHAVLFWQSEVTFRNLLNIMEILESIFLSTQYSINLTLFAVPGFICRCHNKVFLPVNYTY